MENALDFSPLDFTLDYLAAHGALVDVGTTDLGYAVLSRELASALQIPEEVHLSTRPATQPPTQPEAHGHISCGFGSPLLETLIKNLRAQIPVAYAQVSGAPPGHAACETAAGRFVPRNAVADLTDIAHGEATYVAAFFNLTAEADDRFETLLRLVCDTTQGSEPDETFTALLNPLSASIRLQPGAAKGPLPLETVATRAHARAQYAVSSFAESVRRRRDLDLDRIAEYFDSLILDAQAPRRAVSAAAIAARKEHLQSERQQKIEDLSARYAIRVRLSPAAILCVTVPVAQLTIRLRRRKAHGQVVLQVPSESRVPDRLPCSACPDTTLRPVLCDDHLHVLCESCAPSAQGRPRCPTCAGH
jgi:hypothetical protein